MIINNNELRKYISTIENEIISIRREIHMHPETAFEEINTSRIVREFLDEENIAYDSNINKTGVVGHINFGEKGKTLLIRADMDALNIQEETGLEYASKIDGKMHACGHDIHTSILLGVSKVLLKYREKLKGHVKLCFQPAEEFSPHGGAKGMIEEGVLENPKVDAAIALHIWDNEIQSIALRDGYMMGQSNRLKIKIKGSSSHAAQPHFGNDAIVATANVVTALQTVVSRKVDPQKPSVLSIGKINGGSAYNIVCNEVELDATVRCFDDETSEIMEEAINTIAKSTAKAHGCEAIVDYQKGYKATKNDHEMFLWAKNIFKNNWYENKFIEPEYASSGGEDFSAFANEVPALFMWLGMQSDLNKGKVTIHKGNLTPDERAIKYGIEALSLLAIKYLSE